MATVSSGGQVLPTTFTNHFLAHLQVATAHRFDEGRGFFLTVSVDDDATQRTVSHWLHPSIPVVFSFDVSDDSGDRVAPVTLDHKEIDAISAQMELPTGVRGDDAVWWPFAEAL